MMDANLKIVIDDYLREVEKGMQLFKGLIGDKYPLDAWKDKDIPQKGKLSEGVKYEFHGIGCLLLFADYEVDFDFGPDRRYDGFDLWRLSQYVMSCSEKYPKYEKNGVLKHDFESAIARGAVSKLDHPYCNLYFYS